jgi:hypothetical protein
MKNGPGYPGPFTFSNFSCQLNKYRLLSIPRTIKHLTICCNLIHFSYDRPVGNASASGAIILPDPPQDDSINHFEH